MFCKHWKRIIRFLVFIINLIALNSILNTCNNRLFGDKKFVKIRIFMQNFGFYFKMMQMLQINESQSKREPRGHTPPVESFEELQEIKTTVIIRA